MTARHVALVSPHVGPEQRRQLASRFPLVRFDAIGDGGEVPPGGEEAEVVLRVALTKPDLSAVLRAAPRVRWVHTSTAGFDWAIVPEILERQITLTRSAASYAIPIGEFTLALIASFAKRLPELADAQRAGRWASVEPLELAGSTVGVIGAGGIGREVAWRCRALGMRVVATKRTPVPTTDFDEVLGPERLGELLERSDFVVVACPLTHETRGLIDGEALGRMKPSAYLINVARGPIVVASDLEDALRRGVISGAAMDAFDEEPLPADSPLWRAPNLIVTPHTSFKSPHNLERVLGEFEANLERFVAGEPLENRLRDPALGY